MHARSNAAFAKIKQDRVAINLFIFSLYCGSHKDTFVHNIDNHNLHINHNTHNKMMVFDNRYRLNRQNQRLFGPILMICFASFIFT